VFDEGSASWGVSVPDVSPEDVAIVERDACVGAMPRISDMWTADFEDKLLAAIARARCLRNRV
jgi:hypothetical protein